MMPGSSSLAVLATAEGLALRSSAHWRISSWSVNTRVFAAIGTSLVNASLGARRLPDTGSCGISAASFVNLVSMPGGWTHTASMEQTRASAHRRACSLGEHEKESRTMAQSLQGKKVAAL